MTNSCLIYMSLVRIYLLTGLKCLTYSSLTIKLAVQAESKFGYCFFA